MQEYIVFFLTLLIKLISLNSVTGEINVKLPGNEDYWITSVSVQPFANYDNLTVAEIYDKNLALYEEALKLHRGSVVLFPEHGLNGVGVETNRSLALEFSQKLPNNYKEVNPCETYGTGPTEDVVRRLSCLALKYRTYIVVSVIERELCDYIVYECTEDKIRLYSTTMVLDWDGIMLQKYPKYNHYGKTVLDSESFADTVFFRVPYALIDFVIMTSFDMLSDPIMSAIILEMELLYPTAWRGELPFLTPLQIQNGRVVRTQRNLISACYLQPSMGYTGCGIFSHFSSVSEIILPVNDSEGSFEVQVAKLTSVGSQPLPLPQDNSKINMKSSHSSNSNLKKKTSKNNINFVKTNLKDYKYINLINTTNLNQIIEINHNDLNCTLEYELNSISNEFHYKLLAFDGLQIHPDGSIAYKIQVCALVACVADDINSCSEIPSYSSETVFDKLKIKGKFKNYFVIPTLMFDDYLPITDVMFETLSDVEYKYSVETKESLSNVYVFGLHSSNFKPKPVPLSTNNVLPSLVLTMLMFFTSSFV